VRKILGFITLVAVMLACKDSGFQSGGARRFSGGTNGAEANKGDPFGPRNGDPSGLGANSDGNQNGLKSLQDCKKAGIDEVNIALILDASGSQRSTDPQMVRKTASEQFVRKLNQEIAKGAASKVSVAVLYFSRNANIAPNRWIELDGAAAADRVATDLGVATSNLGGGTYFGAALAKASEAFQEKGTTAANPTHRNYAVFLTDGEPNGETAEFRAVELEKLIGNFDVAMIAVAAGSGIRSRGEAQVQLLARPASNSRKPNHIGQYIRSQTDQDLLNAFDRIFDRVVKCD
jgi:uncharacterized protein YegL